MQRNRTALARGADPNKDDAYGRNAVEIAVTSGQEAALHLLLLAGADPTIRCAFNQIVSVFSVTTVELALHCGADINAVDPDTGYSTAHCAAENTRYRIISSLSSFLPLNGLDIDGYTPLHTAIYKENENAIRDLLNANVDVTAIPENGQTVLHMACKRAMLPLIEGLLERGAPLNVRYHEGTELHTLVRGAISRLQNYLYSPEYPHSPKSSSLEGIESHAITVASLLIRYGADVEERDELNRTPALMAAQSQFYKLEDTLNNAMVF